MTGRRLISAVIPEPFRMLLSFMKWDKAININPEDETSYSIQYQEGFLKYVLNKYCANHRRLPVFKPENILHGNVFPCALASGFGQLSFDPYDLSSDDNDYLTPKCIAQMTPG